MNIPALYGGGRGGGDQHCLKTKHSFTLGHRSTAIRSPMVNSNWQTLPLERLFSRWWRMLKYREKLAFSVAAQDQNTEVITAICCTAHTRSDYHDTSAACGAGAQSGCNNQQPTQTGPRWTGLPFLISFPPPASEQSSFPTSGFVLLWNEVRWSIALQISQKV